VTDARYELLKKYMCERQPEEAFTLCKQKVFGRVISKEFCLACMAEHFEEVCDKLWTIVNMQGVKSPSMGGQLNVLRMIYERGRATFRSLAKDMGIGSIDDEREIWMDNVEEFIQRSKVKINGK